MVAPLQNPPLWPYTTFFAIPHACHGNFQKCPTRSYGLWEMVINEFDPREEPGKDLEEQISGRIYWLAHVALPVSLVDRICWIRIIGTGSRYSFLNSCLKQGCVSGSALFYLALGRINHWCIGGFMNRRTREHENAIIALRGPVLRIRICNVHKGRLRFIKQDPDPQ